ncbi:MAG: prepilin-type N-terminal cleavage/methylation domain-containing protein [Gemmataceae bacterium]|nr:prepilin-type N-terminal cleavage/methylation domain-containing protein [Gemmataceae bacterium]MDW8242554.1 prepilin-type N-terminal cleavage/methylation domain-containing protein [Thermogemmata sp.]
MATSIRHSRTAFSVVELLVVIAIVAILAGLTMSGVGYVRIRQQHRTTEQIVYKLQEAVDQLVKATVEQTRKDRLSRARVFEDLVSYCDNDEDRAEALLLYCRLRYTFPQTFNEARSGLTIATINWPPHTAYADLPSGNGPAELEAAVLLRKAVSRLGTGGATFASDDFMGSAQIDVAWPGGGTVPIFADAWKLYGSGGNVVPITFRRFYESPELNAPPYVNPRSVSRDPFDTLGKLAMNWTNKSDAQNRLGVIFDSNNKTITVLSAGADRSFGTNDDIWGYRLRQIGGRGNR